MPQQPTILFVDDEPVLRELLPLWLAQHGYRVLTASSGEEALAILQKETVDVLLTDYNLPGISGAQLIEQVPDKPSIVLYSDAADFPETEKHRLKIREVLSKPIRREILLSALKDITLQS